MSAVCSLGMYNVHVFSYFVSVFVRLCVSGVGMDGCVHNVVVGGGGGVNARPSMFSQSMLFQM